MQHLKLFFGLIICLHFTLIIVAQDTTYAERLGWKKTDKVVILHVDDVGMSFDSNEGAIKAMTAGVATSCSVMMPCAWVPGFIHYLRDHPQLDAGLHLTLTSEWKDYRWGPLAGKAETPGLTDPEGALWPSVEQVVKNASAEEVDKEIRAQLERATKMGFKPSHLDSHMGTLFATPAFLEKYVQLGIEQNIPVMLPGGHDILITAQTKLVPAQVQQIRILGKMLWNAGLPVLDDLHNMSYGWTLPPEVKPTDENLRNFKTKKYMEAFREIKPGITMVIMHCTDPTEVFSHISDSGPVRKADLLAMLNPELKKFIQQEGIILTTWTELKKRREKKGL